MKNIVENKLLVLCILFENTDRYDCSNRMDLQD